MEPAVAGSDAALVGVGLANLELKPPALEIHVSPFERVLDFRGWGGVCCWCLVCFHIG